MSKTAVIVGGLVALVIGGVVSTCSHSPPTPSHGDRPLHPKYPPHTPIAVDARIIAPSGEVVGSLHALGWNVEYVKLSTGIDEDGWGEALTIFPALLPDGRIFVSTDHTHRHDHVLTQNRDSATTHPHQTTVLHGASGTTIELEVAPR